MEANYPKLFNEHRVAWDKIVEIENSNDTQEKKINNIISLFQEELLPHFKDEENTCLKDNYEKESLDLLNDHKNLYDITDRMKAGTATKDDVDKFISILKDHIKKEDKYFGRLQKKNNNKSSLLFPALIVLAIIVLVVYIGHNLSE